MNHDYFDHSNLKARNVKRPQSTPLQSKSTFTGLYAKAMLALVIIHRPLTALATQNTVLNKYLPNRALDTLTVGYVLPLNVHPPSLRILALASASLRTSSCVKRS